MPQRRRDFADRINYREQAPPPRAQDPLSAIAPLLRVRPELQAVCRFASQWDVTHDAEPGGLGAVPYRDDGKLPAGTERRAAIYPSRSPKRTLSIAAIPTGTASIRSSTIRPAETSTG